MQPAASPTEFDGTRFTQNLGEAFSEWQALLSEFARPTPEQVQSAEKDFRQIGEAFFEMATRLASDPAKLAQMQMGFYGRLADVWQQSIDRFFGVPRETAQPVRRDRRFDDPAWNENAWFSFLKESYLLGARWLEEISRQPMGLDPRTARKIDFYTRQFIDAVAPSNFLLTNPQALRATLDSHGENLVKGIRQLRRDISLGGGRLQVRMSDDTAFRLGENIAATPGKVVFRNELIELIQYAPSTASVHEVPLLLIPAWINKFYIFDMQRENSFVRWLTEQGFTVFVISWVNPDAEHAQHSFDHYLSMGPLAALDEIERITGSNQTAAIGYCLGGTLLAITLSWLKAKGQSGRVVSATFLTTMIDFAEPGELGIFIDEPQLEAMEARMSATGYLDGKEMAATFNMLRANDLIWSFVVNNYLLGKEPFPFDLLYWNADSTRMPAKMHSFYLRNMYLNNKLKRPGGITVGGVPIDLTTIETPSYLLSTREDHIAPWRSTFSSTRVYGAPLVFTLAASGHIAGVINPPQKEKYGYWTGTLKPGIGASQWLDQAKESKGSWWPHWRDWQAKRLGGKVAARALPENNLGDAPGEYVRQR